MAATITSDDQQQPQFLVQQTLVGRGIAHHAALQTCNQTSLDFDAFSHPKQSHHPTGCATFFVHINL